MFAWQTGRDMVHLDPLTEDAYAAAPDTAWECLLSEIEFALERRQPIAICMHRPVIGGMFGHLRSMCVAPSLSKRLIAKTPFMPTGTAVALFVTRRLMVPKSSIFRRFNRLSTRPAFPDSSNSSAAAAAAHAAHNGAAGSLGPLGSLRAAGRHSTCSHGFFTPLAPGSALDPAVADGLASGMDPQALSEMSHLSAAALLDRVRHSEDPAVVERVLTLVETVGVDEIAELWSDTEPDSLPGVLWRLYMLRTWMRSNRDSIAHLWRFG